MEFINDEDTHYVFYTLADLRHYYENTRRGKSGQAREYLSGLYGEEIEFYVIPSRAFGVKCYNNLNDMPKVHNPKVYRRYSFTGVYKEF